MPTVTLYKLVGGIIFLAVFGAACAFLGWRSPHDALVKYHAEVEQAGREQEARTNAVDKQHKEEMKNAATSMEKAVTGIDDYYKQHPVVRVRDVCASSSGSVPQAASGAKKLDGTPSAEYASPYRPDEVEKVAARLYELQQLLLKDGVLVE